MKHKLKCTDCQFQGEWDCPSKTGSSREAKKAGWKLWRGAGWCCWPCSIDRARALITEDDREAARKRFPVVNAERMALICKKFSKGLTKPEEGRLNRLQRKTAELEETFSPILNTAYFRTMQLQTMKCRKIQREIQGMLDKAHAKQLADERKR